MATHCTYTHEAMARLSWPGWLAIYWDSLRIGFLHRGFNPGPVTHSSINRARRRVFRDQRASTKPNRHRRHFKPNFNL